MILCEGDSAKAGVISGLSSEDKNVIGVYPLKGKLLNVRGETITKISENKEITEIMEALTSVANGELTATEFMEFYYPSHMSYEIDLDGFLYYENEHIPPYIVQIPQRL